MGGGGAGKIPPVKARDDKFLFPFGVLSCRHAHRLARAKQEIERRREKKIRAKNLTLSGNFIVLKIDSYFICASRFFSVGGKFLVPSSCRIVCSFGGGGGGKVLVQLLLEGQIFSRLCRAATLVRGKVGAELSGDLPVVVVRKGPRGEEWGKLD